MISRHPFQSQSFCDSVILHLHLLLSGQNYIAICLCTTDPSTMCWVSQDWVNFYTSRTSGYSMSYLFSLYLGLLPVPEGGKPRGGQSAAALARPHGFFSFWYFRCESQCGAREQGTAAASVQLQRQESLSTSCEG